MSKQKKYRGRYKCGGEKTVLVVNTICKSATTVDNSGRFTLISDYQRSIAYVRGYNLITPLSINL